MKKKSDPKPSQHFLEETKLIELNMEADKIRHKSEMERLIFRRESDKISHDKKMERQRIKSAEIRRTIDRKMNKNFMENYSR